MIGKLIYLLVALLAVGSATIAFSQNVTNDVHAKLSLADAKTTYRVGEPIELVLEFTADRDGYQADVLTDATSAPTDQISLTPDAGVNHWLEELLNGRQYLRDVISFKALSSVPTPVTLLLNSSLRIDRPGKYSVKVISKRVMHRSKEGKYYPPIELATNEVAFEILPMSDIDEQKEVKRLSDLLDATHDWQTEEKWARELSYLIGDASSREKVRRFLSSEGRSGNYSAQIYYGLFIARNRALVLQLLEAAMRDPNKPVTATLLSSIISLRFLQQNASVVMKAPIVSDALDPNDDPRSREIQDAYVTELAAGLAKRTGKSQTTTAMTILMHLPKDAQAQSTLLAEVRRVLVSQFDSLHRNDQEYLLGQYWEQLKDPSMVPPLEKMLGYNGPANMNFRDAALKRLIEIAPDKARSYVIAEIVEPSSLVRFETLASLPDKSLPEVDAALLAQIGQLASSKNVFFQMYLKQKTSLAARFATDAIYPDLMEIYRNAGAKMPVESRSCLLAYFARYNEQVALSLIEQAGEEIPPDQEFNFLPQLTQLYFSEAIDALLRKRLESDEPRIASNAAYLISLHGSANDQAALETRLERWRKEWSSRRIEADTNLQGTIESEIVRGLIHAKSWKLSPDRIKELEQSCITRYCRQNFPVQ